MNQGAHHQLPPAVGKGEGGDAHLRPKQGEQGERQQHPQRLNLIGEAAVREHEPREMGRAEQGEAAQQVAQQRMGGGARQSPRQDADEPLLFHVFHERYLLDVTLLTPA